MIVVAAIAALALAIMAMLALADFLATERRWTILTWTDTYIPTAGDSPARAATEDQVDARMRQVIQP